MVPDAGRLGASLLGVLSAHDAGGLAGIDIMGFGSSRSSAQATPPRLLTAVMHQAPAGCRGSAQCLIRAALRAGRRADQPDEPWERFVSLPLRGGATAFASFEHGDSGGEYQGDRLGVVSRAGVISIFEVGDLGLVRPRLDASERNGRLLVCAEESCADPAEPFDDAMDTCSRHYFKANLNALRRPCLLLDSDRSSGLLLSESFARAQWGADPDQLEVEAFTFLSPDQLRHAPATVAEASEPAELVCPGTRAPLGSWGPTVALHSMLRLTPLPGQLAFVRFEGAWFWSDEKSGPARYASAAFGCPPDSRTH